MNLSRTVIRCGLYSALYLSGSMLLAFLAAFTFASLPMHMSESMNAIFAFSIVVLFTTAAGALWGRSIAKVCRSTEVRAMTLAGALGFGPVLILVALTLGKIEVVLVEQSRGPDIAIHVLFTLLFVPAAFVVAGAGGLASGLAHKDGRLALQMGLGSGLVGAAGFLLVNLTLDAVGWRVGAPGAAERATMLTVMMAGSLGAALCGGGMTGLLLTRLLQKRSLPVSD